MEKFSNFENRAERGEEALEERLKEIAAELRESDIDVDDFCRIDMEAYEPLYGQQVKKDMYEIKQREKKWQKEKPNKEGKQRKRTNGEKMEMFKTALFHKAIGKNFFVLRSSPFDDCNNGIDNVIVEKETGAVVGAFDEVVAKNGKTEKEGKVAARNTRSGAFLKYGIGAAGAKTTKQSNHHIPLFYLALEEKELNDAINDFNLSEEEFSELEKELLKKLAASVKEQTKLISEIGMFKNKTEDIKKFQTALQEATE